MANSDESSSPGPTLLRFFSKWEQSVSNWILRSQSGPLQRELNRYTDVVESAASSPEIERARGAMCADWMFRSFMPAVLDLAPELRTYAKQLRGAPRYSPAENSASNRISEVAALRASTLAQELRDALPKQVRERVLDAMFGVVAIRDPIFEATFTAFRRDQHYAIRDNTSGLWDALYVAAWRAQESGGQQAALELLDPLRFLVQRSAFRLLDRMTALGYEPTERDRALLAQKRLGEDGQMAVEALRVLTAAEIFIQPGSEGLVAVPDVDPMSLAPDTQEQLRMLISRGLPGVTWDPLPLPRDVPPSLYWWSWSKRSG